MTTVISAHENLIDVVASLLDVLQRDLSNYIVVFPGKRPAHFLRKKLGEMVGHSFIPPCIYSMDTFIEFLAKEKLGMQFRVIDSLDAVAVLFDIHRDMKERIGGEHFHEPERFLPLGLKLFGELEELILADIEVRGIKSNVQGIPYGKLNLLAEYYERFYRELSVRHLSTRAVQYASVARQIDGIDLGEFLRCIVAGFFAHTPAEKKIFENLRGRTNVELVFQRVEGLSIPAIVHDEKMKVSTIVRTNEPEIHYTKAPDTHGQVFALGAVLKEMLARGEHLNERYAIVLPTAEALFPLIHETLALLPENTYNIALGYPLSRTPLYGFINTLVELVVSMEDGKIPAAAYLTFLLHPYTKNIRYHGKSEVTRVLMHTIEEHLAEDRSKLFFTLEEIESWTQMLDAAVKNVSADGEPLRQEDMRTHLVSIHDRTIRALIGMNSAGEFARRCIQVLTYIYEQSTASLHPLFRQYAERMIEVFEAIESSLMNRAHFKEPAGYANLLKHYIAAQDVPFSGTPLKGVQVLGLLETRNLQFDTVFVLDVNEDILPPGRGEDMLLPQSLRQTLGLETYREREKLVEYYFQLLLQSARHVHLFFSETNVGDKERSRFVQKLLWKKEKEIGTLLEDNAVASVCYHIKLENAMPAPVMKTPEMAEHLRQIEYSATKLDMYLRCPLQFYYRFVLRLDEKETIEEELDQRDAGEIVHAVLRELFMPFIGCTLTQANISAMPLEETVKREFRKRFGEELLGDRYLMCLQVMRQIDRFLKQYQMPLLEAEEVNVIGVETELQAVENGIILRARCDRIERRGKSVHIIDYKIWGSNARTRIDWQKLVPEERNAWNEAIGSLQLAFYMLVYQLCRSDQDTTIVPVYLLLGKNMMSRDVEVPLFDEDAAVGERYDVLKNIIYALIREIQDSAVPFSPPHDLKDTCLHCPFTTLCGTAWVGG